MLRNTHLFLFFSSAVSGLFGAEAGARKASVTSDALLSIMQSCSIVSACRLSSINSPAKYVTALKRIQPQ